VLTNQEIHYLVLSGGKGTRSADPSLPKILQSVSATATLLDLHFENLARSGASSVTFLLGHGSELVIEAIKFRKAKYKNLAVDWVTESHQRGTSQAVADVIWGDQAPDKFCVVLGDTAINADIDLLSRQWLSSGMDVALVAHPNRHPDDSDLIVFDNERLAIGFAPKGSVEKIASSTFLPLTGLLFFDKKTFQTLTPSNPDLVQWLIDSALGRRQVQVLSTSHYFKDSGTLKRIESIRADFISGSLQRRGASKRSAIFVDRDGTLIRDLGSSRAFLGPNEVPAAIGEAIAEVNAAGVPIFMVTNQPGLAKGQFGVSELNGLHNALFRQMADYEGLIDDYSYCPHHPETGFLDEVVDLKILCACRKPKPGMVLALAEKHDLHLTSSFMLGDSLADEELAQVTGMFFLKCDVLKPADGVGTAAAIREALERILNAYH
jgi:mannose-1-phosphate guanylyltransferase/phosphomannomutase